MRLTYWNDRKGHFDWRCENNEIADKLAAYEEAAQKDGGQNEALSGPYDLLYEEGGYNSNGV